MTQNTHEPPSDPYGRGNTAENMWDAFGMQFEKMYANLEASGFFEHGTLVVLGDHRKWTPLLQDELAQFGESARARVPLVVFNGKDSGIDDDCVFSQANLLEFIEKGERSCAPVPFILHRSRAKDWQGSAFITADSFAAWDFKLAGNKMSWITKIPPGEHRIDSIEASIHSQRAAAQYFFFQSGEICQDILFHRLNGDLPVELANKIKRFHVERPSVSGNFDFFRISSQSSLQLCVFNSETLLGEITAADPPATKIDFGTYQANNMIRLEIIIVNPTDESQFQLEVSRPGIGYQKVFAWPDTLTPSS